MGLERDLPGIGQMNEIELYLLINLCGAFVWRMNHDMNKGVIAGRDCAAVNEDCRKMLAQQKEAVRELPRIGVNTPLDTDGKPTDEYWTWYRTWDAWKKSLTDAEWESFDAVVNNGLSEEQVAYYKSLAFKPKEQPSEN